MKFVFTGQAYELFNKRKYFFDCIPIFISYNSIHHIMLEYNMSEFAILVLLL